MLKKSSRRPLPHGRGSVTRCESAGVFLSPARQRAVLALFQHPARTLFRRWQRHSGPGLFVCALLLLPRSLPAEIIDRVAVAVGRGVITTSDIEREIRITALLNGTPVDFSRGSRDATADRLIEQKLIRQELESSSYQSPDPGEIEPVIEKFKKDHYANEAEYRSALASYGIAEQDLKNALLWQRALLLFINARFRPSIDVKGEEVEQQLQKEVAAARAARPDQALNIEELRRQIEESIIERRIDEAMTKWLEDVRRRTRVLIRMEVFR
jgi:hypothetical protein